MLACLAYHSLFSLQISRESIDALKKYFRDEMSKNEWQLIIELKKLFGIMWENLFEIFVAG